jgi:mitochondrial fission protein ELM1
MFGLAEKLHKTVSEILQMSVTEFNMWMAYYKLQTEEQERQHRLMKARRGN